MIQRKTQNYTINNKKNGVHPRDEANFFSHFLFCWQLRTLIQIWRNKISCDDLIVPVTKHESNNLGNNLEKTWNQEMSKKNPSLSKPLIQLFGLEFALWGLFYFVVDVTLCFVQPLYVGKLLEYFLKTTQITNKQAYIYGMTIVLCGIFRGITYYVFIMETYSIGLRIRTAFCSLIYRKTLMTKTFAIQKYTLAQLLSLISNDVDKFETVFSYLHCVCIVILKLAVALYFFYAWCGYQAIVASGILIPFLLFQYFIIRVATARQKKLAQVKDSRMGIMTDIIFKIKAIKMYAWETHFAEKVKTFRRAELNHTVKLNHILNENFTLAFYIQKISIYVYILFLISTDSSLNPKLIFLFMNIQNIIKSPLQHLMTTVNIVSDTKVSMTRIENFLLLDQDKDVAEVNVLKLKNYKVLANKVTTKWESSCKETLNDINFELHSGEIVAIMGHSGSGKSSLLQLLLKELPIIKGTLYIKGSISYASQNPWVFPATLQQNITIGEAFNESKYRKVLRVCALEHDVSYFPHGDNTLVGERGIMLSGGQKSRVNLARAIYKDADIYLLDDPLAAVDSTVAHQIFTECLLEYLKDKSVVLVTHQLTFISKVDRIYVLENGKIKDCGKYKAIEQEETLFEQNYQKAHIEEPERKLLESYTVQSEVKEDNSRSVINNYTTYLFACKHKFFVYAQFVIFILTQLFMDGSDMFVSFWITLKHQSSKLSPTLLHFFSDTNCFYLYSGFIFTIAVLSHSSNYVFVKSCKQISIKLHDTLFGKILHGSMKFFNDQPSGRIVNRMSKDVSAVDEFIPRNMYQTIRQVCAVLGICFVIICINYFMSIPTIVLGVLFYGCSRALNPILHQLKRISATRKSPILTHVASTVEGLTTIKVLEAQKYSLAKLDSYQDHYSSVRYFHQALQCANGFWIDCICLLYTSVIIFYLIIFKQDDSVGKFGLSITETLLLIGTAQYMMRLYGDLDSQMTSVERVVEYRDLTTEEDKGSFSPPTPWPTEGKLSIQAVNMRYSPEKPYILKNINLEIQPGEKIGIVGRTGAGKSSFISTIFRLYDFEGTILIDNVDTKLLTLNTLRSKIAMIPQDPVIFSGTIRNNLDPLKEFTDIQLWSALDEVKLKEMISNLPSGLESLVLEDGTNFSVGQRQILCLARAVLKQSTIVVLDEATAYIDLETDKLIQATIRKRFAKSTVLKIAHRLDTVLDSDKILVIEDGSVVEFGATDDLLRNKNGHFYRYVHKLK